MDKNLVSRWKWGIIAALAMTFLTFLPQVNLWFLPERQWQGSYVLLHADEVAYSAYINALIDGRTRRNDPYTGRDQQLDQQQTESLFSIQFIPAYLIAVPARVLGLSADAAFIWLLVISTFLSTVAIFWLIRAVTGNDKLAAAGAVFVLCFGAMIAGYGELRGFLGAGGAGNIIMPFTRRYQPSATFPLFFLFCGLVWYAFTASKKQTAILTAVGAGLCLAALIFSYFFLWTAAVAWLAGLALLHSGFWRSEWKRNLTVTAIVGAIGAAGLVPYLNVLSQRAKSLDDTQALIATRMPDLLRPCEIVGLLLLAAILYAVRSGKINLKDNLTLFATSFAVLPFIVFNQQVLTGFSLQPVHYELYIANYVVLVALLITGALLWQTWRQAEVSGKALFWLALIAFGWGFVEIAGVIKKDTQYIKIHDDAMPVLRKLAEIGKANNLQHLTGEPETVLVADIDVADILPTVAPQPVLWSPHIPVYSGLQSGEGKERFFKYLYYTGTTPKDVAQALYNKDFAVTSAVFGYERALPALAAHTKPVTTDEIQTELRNFAQYSQLFTREKAAEHPISFVIVHGKGSFDPANLDRWYERDKGEIIGQYVLYRVKLR